MKCGRSLVLTLFLSVVAPAFAGCAANRAAATLIPSLDGRYLVQSGGGRVALWARKGRSWRLSWRRIAAVNSLAIPAENGGEPTVVLGAGGALKAFDRTSERWTAGGPPGLAVRGLTAADLNSDGQDEAIALYGPTLGGAAQTLVVFNMAGCAAAKRGDADHPVLAVTAGNLDGAKGQELAIAERGPDGAITLGLFALTPEGLAPLGKTTALPSGLRALASADLVAGGGAEIVAAFERPGRIELRTYRSKDAGLHPSGKTLRVDEVGDLQAAGPRLLALRVRDGRWWSYIVIGWKEGGPAVRTRLERFRAGAFLVSLPGEGLELLAAGSRGPQSLLRVE